MANTKTRRRRFYRTKVDRAGVAWLRFSDNDDGTNSDGRRPRWRRVPRGLAGYDFRRVFVDDMAG